MPVNRPEFNFAVETNWDGVDLEEFDSFEQFAEAHVWHNVEDPKTTEDVELPVVNFEDGDLKLVYEALNSAHDLASRAIEDEEDVRRVRTLLEELRRQEFPEREPLNSDGNTASLDYIRSISEDEVSECISEKVDEGVPQDRAVAICLSEAEEGSITPTSGKQEYEVGDTTVDITPPDQMVNAAEAAQKAQEEGLIPDECGTGIGDRRADQIVNDEVGPEVIDEIASYLTSHEEDVTAEGSPTDWNEEEWSDCGNAQYAKWGGVNDGEMKRWAQEKANEVAEARGEELPYPERESKQGEFQFEIGGFVSWEFGDGTSQGEIIDMTAEVGDSMSAGGNTFTVEEGDDPLYKIVEWDENEESFTNHVVKFEDSLSTAERPEAAERKQEEIEEAEQSDEKNTMDKSKDLDGKQVAQKRLESVQNTKGVRIKENDDGDTIAENVPIQATTEDRDGDIITEEGQKEIVEQLEEGTVPLFLNHGVGSHDAHYDVRDIIGHFIGGKRQDGKTFADVRFLENDEDAEKLQKLMENDMPVGFSVGFIPQETETMEEGGEKIFSLDLMETSAVGIPSNADSVINPMKSGEALATAVKNMVREGVSDEIVGKVASKAVNTMTEKEEGQSTDENTSKSDNELKQITQEDMDAVLGAVSGAIDAHIDEAMQDIEQELESMVQQNEAADEEDEDMEEESQHTDEEDGDKSSDHTEGEDEKSESSESEQESTADKNKGAESNDLSGSDSENQEKDNQQKSEVIDPRMAL